jgi:hypothetical protein
MKGSLTSTFPFGRIFRYELLRLNRIDVWVTGIIFSIILLILGFASTLNELSGEGPMINPLLLEQGFPSLAGLFMVFFVMLGLGTEYRQGTFRKRLLNGYSRVDLMFVPLLMIFFAMLIFSLIVISTMLIVQIISGYDMFHFWNTHILANLLLRQLLIGAFGGMLVHLTRTAGLAIVIYFVYGFLESILSLGFSFALQEPGLSAYLPLNLGSSFRMLNENQQTWFDLVPAIWTGLFMGISWLRVKNTEF